MVENIDEILNHSEVIIIGNRSEEFVDIMSSLSEEIYIIDLVRITKMIKTKAKYDGICW